MVPHATTLPHPLDSRHVEARNPEVASDVKSAHKAMGDLFAAARLAGPPKTFAVYLNFVDAQLARWKTQGALAVKFYDANDRTLLFRDVPRARRYKFTPPMEEVRSSV